MSPTRRSFGRASRPTQRSLTCHSLIGDLQVGVTAARAANSNQPQDSKGEHPGAVIVLLINPQTNNGGSLIKTESLQTLRDHAAGAYENIEYRPCPGPAGRMHVRTAYVDAKSAAGACSPT